MNQLRSHAQTKAEESRLLASAEREPETNIDNKAKVYAELARLDPTNATYQRKYTHYSRKVEVRNKKAVRSSGGAW